MDSFSHKEALFKNAFSAYGKPGVFSSDFRDLQGLKEVRAILRFCLAGHKRAYGKKGIIHFDYLQNQRFNAMATTVDGHKLISIFSGTIFHLYRLFFCFFSDPQVLPIVGNVKNETVSNDVLKSILAGTYINQHPKDPDRLTAAQGFVTVCCILILNHEIGHIVNCHVHLLNKQQIMNVYEELPDPGVIRNNLFHAFEWEADEYSSICTYLFLQRLGIMFPIVEKLGADYIISASMLMLFLYIHSQSSSTFRSKSPTHPSPFDRWVWSVMQIETSKECKTFNPKSELIQNGINDVLSFWSRNGLLDKTRFNYSVEALEETKTNYQEVRQSFRMYHSDLEMAAEERKEDADKWLITNKLTPNQILMDALMDIEKNRIIH